MRQCPKCCKEYDDSWNVCINCSVQLVKGVSFLDNIKKLDRRQRIDKMKEESGRIRKEISALEVQAADMEKMIASEEALLASGAADIVESKDSSRPPAAGIRQKSGGRTIEQVVGSTIFSIIGVVFTVLGFAIFAIPMFFMLSVLGKIITSYIAAIVMMTGGQGLVSRNKFADYGRILIAGGWALAFYLTYAIHSVPQACLIKDPFIASLAVLAVSAGAIVHMVTFRSEIAVTCAIILSYATLALSSASISMVMALIPVTFTAAYFVRRSGWLLLGSVSIVTAYISTYMWLNAPHPQMPIIVRSVWAFIVGGITFIVFLPVTIPAERRDSGKVGWRELPFALNIILFALLTFSLKFASWAIFVSSVSSGWAILCVAIAVILYRHSLRSMCVISSAFAIIFTEIFITMALSGSALFMAHVLLAEAVFLAGFLLKEPSWRVFGAVYSMALIWFLLLVDRVFIVNIASISSLWARIATFFFIFAIYPLNRWAYIRFRAGSSVLPVEDKLINIFLYSYTAIYAVGTWLDAPKALIASLWILPGAFFLEAGIRKENAAMRAEGHILSIGAFLWLVLSSIAIPGAIGPVSYRMLASVPALILIYYCSRLAWDASRANTLSRHEKNIRYIYPYAVFTVLALLLKYQVPMKYVSLAWAVLAMVYAVTGVYSTRNYLLSIASVSAILASGRAIFINLYQSKYLVGVSFDVYTALGCAAILACGNVLYIISRSRIEHIERSSGSVIGAILRSSRIVFSASATLVIAAVIMAKASGFVLTVCWGIQALVTFGLGFILKERSWRLSGLILLLIASLKGIFFDLGANVFGSLMIMGMLLLFVSWIYTRYSEQIRKAI